MNFEPTYCEGINRKTGKECGNLASFICIKEGCHGTASYCLDHFGPHLLRDHQDYLKSIIAITPLELVVEAKGLHFRFQNELV